MRLFQLLVCVLLYSPSIAFGQVTQVTATPPIYSSGGTTPNISITSGTMVLQSTSASANNPILLIQNTAATELMRVTQDGRVGIATANPAYVLDVAGAARVAQMIVGGTITVSGNAFSVGGSTFIIQSGRIRVGPMIYTSTATNSSFFVNAWQIVAATNPTGASFVRFTGLNPSSFYRLRWNYVLDGSGGGGFVQFNDDSGSTYRFSVLGLDANTNEVQTNGIDFTQCPAEALGSDLDQGAAAGSIEFNAARDGTAVMGAGLVQIETFTGEENSLETSTMGCFYQGSSSLASVTYTLSSGSMTGYFYLEQLEPALP